MPYTDPARKLANDRRYKDERRAELAAKQRDYHARNRDRDRQRNDRYLAERPLLRQAIGFANASNRRAAAGGANLIENIVRCCAWCNKSKGARLLSEWRPSDQAVAFERLKRRR